MIALALQIPVRISSPLSSRRNHLPAPLSPVDLGLPDQFREWRPEQWHAIETIVDSPKRFVAICAPTGAGKSLLSFGAAMLSGKRTAFLTATKPLQDQIQRDFSSISTDIRGMANYPCVAWRELEVPESTNVSEAPCQCGYKCPWRTNGCTYFDLYRQAQAADILVTNYQCWMYDDAKGKEGFHIDPVVYAAGEPDDPNDHRIPVRMLICDEFHAAHDQLSKFLGVDLSRRECLGMRLDWPDSGQSWEDWRDWASAWLSPVNDRIEDAERKLKLSRNGGGRSWSKELRHLRDIKRKLQKLAGMKAEDEWILNEEGAEGRSMQSVRFDPLSPARYAESALWRGVEKVVLVSATVRPKTAELLGIRSEELEFVEYDSSFDKRRRPVIYVPTVRMSYRTEGDDLLMREWLRLLDRLIEARLEWKGIIHSVSYKRAKFILDNSRWAGHMLTHNSRDREQKIAAFRAADPPCVLVSPSVDTGFDFPQDSARWQVIAKIPFASVQDKVIKVRQERDKEYGLYLAAQTLVQATGRIVRGESDWGESLILDGQAEWFVGKVRKFLPRWWLEAYRWAEDGLPEFIGREFGDVDAGARKD